MSEGHDGRYRFSYADAGVYGHVLGLVRGTGAPGACVLDVGCGYGAIAEPSRDAGFGYAGLDLDPDAVADLQARGHHAVVTDLRDVERLARDLETALDGHPLAAITLLDTLEHLTNGVAVLRELHRLAATRGPVPLVVSVPNVTHLDLAAKTLLGRWDVTATGLLDETHVSLYGLARLEADMAAAGWVEVAADDYRLAWSDQHFPPDAAPLAFTTPLHRTLARVRESAAPAATVNQFVRAYLPGPEAAPDPEPTATARPLLSVVVATGGADVAALPDTLLCLAGQDEPDLEVVVVGHNTGAEHEAAVRNAVVALPGELSARIRHFSVDGGPLVRPWAAGARAARGRLVAFLTAGAMPLGHWAARFAALAAAHPGHVLRSGVAEQDSRLEPAPGGPVPVGVGPTVVAHPLRADLLEHLRGDRAPLSGVAFPASCFDDLGLGFDETLPAGAGWDLFLRAALWCGVADAGEVTVLDRRWVDGAAPDRRALPPHVVDLVLGRLDAEPLLLPAGSVGLLRGRTAPRPPDDAHARLRELEARLDEVYRSTSWRASAPVRFAGRGVGRLRRSLGR